MVQPVPVCLLGPFLLAMVVPTPAAAQQLATASATSVLILRIPPRGHLVTPKQLSRALLGEQSRLGMVEQVGLFEVGTRTTHDTGNGVLLAEWTASPAGAPSLSSFSPLDGTIAARPPSRLAGPSAWAGRRVAEGLRVRLHWDPNLPYRDQWASVSTPRLPAAGEPTSKSRFPALRGRLGAGELRAEAFMTRGIAVPLLTVGPGQMLIEGRFHASVEFPQTWPAFGTAVPAALTLTLTEY